MLSRTRSVHAQYRAAGVVNDVQTDVSSNHQPSLLTAGPIVGVDEADDDVQSHASGLTVLERDKDHLVAVE